MKVDEIWEFDNGVAYDLCRIVREKPVAAIHNGGREYIIREDAKGWTKVGKATHPLKFNPRISNAKTQK